jgi:hypothetical protein
MATCCGVGSAQATDLYWANPTGNAIGHAVVGPSGPTDVNHSFVGSAGSPFGVTADGTYVYWANRAADALGRARLDRTGTDEPTWINAGITDPRGLAALDNSIYFTHTWAATPFPGEVGRLNRNGTGLQSSFVIGGTGPDPCGLGFFSDRIMFANQNPTDSIGRSHGMFPETQNFITATDNPCGVASTDALVYWANQGSNSIGRANFDGTGAVQNWLQLAPGTVPCAVTIAGDHIYWTATGTDQIGRAEIGPGGPVDVDEDYISGVTDSCGLTATPRAQASPTSAAFADTTVGSESDAVALSVSNRSSSALDIGAVTVLGANPGDFEIADGCTGTFAITGCLINVRFAPTAEGQRTAIVRVVSNADNSPTEIQLSGGGVAPASPPPPEEPPAEPPPAEPPPPKQHSRSLTISHAAKADRFKGLLEADEVACVDNQKVAVFRERRGADRRVGSDRTDANGRWKVDGTGDDGRFYAAVKEGMLPGGDTCLAATSPKVRAG